MTVAVVAIIAAVGLPSLTSFVENQQLNSVTQTVNNTLTLARLEALKRQQAVRVCFGFPDDTPYERDMFTIQSGQLVTFTPNLPRVEIGRVSYDTTGVVITPSDTTFQCANYNPQGRFVNIVSRTGTLDLNITSATGSNTTGRAIRIMRTGRSFVVSIEDDADDSEDEETDET